MMKPIPKKARLKVAMAVVRYLHESPTETAKRFPTGTSFAPVGTDDDGTVLVTVSPPATVTETQLERIPRTA
jgi:hypothetical protein